MRHIIKENTGQVRYILSNVHRVRSVLANLDGKERKPVELIDHVPEKKMAPVCPSCTTSCVVRYTSVPEPPFSLPQVAAVVQHERVPWQACTAYEGYRWHQQLRQSYQQRKV